MAGSGSERAPTMRVFQRLGSVIVATGRVAHESFLYVVGQP